MLEDEHERIPHYETPEVELVHNINGWWLFLIFALVVGLWLSCYYVMTIQYFPESTDASGNPVDSWPKRGQFGDMFGAVNALFSGLAFATIVITIWQQRIDLRLQKVALKASQDEIKIQNQTLATQNTTLRRQRFENTFFTMMSIHFRILEVHSIVILFGNITKRFIATSITRSYNSVHHNDYEIKFQDVMKPYVGVTAQYFQSLLNLYNTIIDSKFQPDAERRYLDVFRGYISLPERILFYYFIIFSKDTPFNNKLRSMEKKLLLLNTLDESDFEEASHVNIKNYYYRSDLYKIS